MKATNSKTIQAHIYISGPIGVIEQACRRECFRAGLCVTVTPTKFVYTGGEETGAVIGLCNYPLYPTSSNELGDRAMLLARGLLEETYQQKVMVVTGDKTTVIEAAKAGKGEG